MDIVDSFNHLIPENLDDALFLGSNLESEGCDEFISSDNAIEDSLKNMLSDKDPMLGSASTQFSLPVLDGSDPNFQLACSTEPVRSLRQSTVAKRSKAPPALSPKKIPLVSAATLAVGAKEDSFLKSSEVVDEHADEFQVKAEHSRALRRSGRRVNQTEKQVKVPLPVVKKSNMIGEYMRKETTDRAETKWEEGSEVKSDKISNCSRTHDSHSAEEERHIKVEIATQFEHTKSNVQNIRTEKEALACITLQSEGDGGNKMNEILKTMKENSSSVLAEPSNQAFVTAAEGNKVMNVLPGAVGEESACSSWLQVSVDPVVKNTGLVNNCRREALEEENSEGQVLSLSGKCFESVVSGKKTKENLCTSEQGMKSVLDSSHAQEFHTQKSSLVTDAVRPKRQAKRRVDALNNKLAVKSTKSKKNVNKSVSKSIQYVQESRQNSDRGAEEKCLLTRKGLKKTRTHTVQVKTIQPVGKQSTGKGKPSTVEPTSQISVKTGKGRKVHPAKNDKMHSYNLGAKVTSKLNIVDMKKTHHTLVQKSLASSLVDKPKIQQSSPGEGHHSVSMHMHTHSQPDHIGHPNQRQTPKQHSVLLKTSDQGKDEGEQKDPMIAERLKEEETLKLKKGLQPRQRRSSKSISVDEPPLFIPDNMAAVKKDSVEHSSPSDKNPSLHAKQCASCKKHHVNRFMVGCWQCGDWLHGECIGLSLSQAHQMRDEGKEYVCVKCSAGEDKRIESCDDTALKNEDKTGADQENKTVESKKTVISKETICSFTSSEKPKQTEERVKNKIKLYGKGSGDRCVSESKELDSRKVHTTPMKKSTPISSSSRLLPEEKNDKLHKHLPNVTLTEDKMPKSGTLEKHEHKKKTEKRLSISNMHPTTPPAPKPSVDQIRQSVRHTLTDILLKRLSESGSKIPEERATKVATKIEKELFSFYRDIDSKYKNKYRSLMFNLRDPKNNVLYKRVLKGDISPDHLIRMSPEELASKELAAWRQRENRHTIEMIEKEQRDAERRPITKITHKGEIEIESESSLKEAEAMEIEEPTVAKPVEKVEELPKEKAAEPASTSDTTNQHKDHLFDLNCKICTGRMAPPSEDLSPKKVKIAVGVARKHSDNEVEHMEEDIASALSTASSILASDIAEAEKTESPKTTISSPVRPRKSVAIEDETTFLARLSYIWKGFINMPSVAKFVIKAYPVSGSLDHLTKDLPDSIQVGGRISPQTVWDYVDKIKASGTKETCLIRFCPVTEEDQISYTLLYAYFSSRKRYGVVANNMRQVKDMYLIPLGASEKVPRFLVPFDGPGLESRRPNLLLALIIRQRLKRLHSTSLDEEALGNTLDVTPEKKQKTEVTNEEEADVEDEDENEFFNSFTTVLHKSRSRSQELDDDDDDDDDVNDDDDDDIEPQTAMESLPITSKSEPPKPLRFLPGVLVGWENQSSTLDLVNKPLPVDDILQSLFGDSENIFDENETTLDENSKLNEVKRVNKLTNDCVSVTRTTLDESQESTKVKKSVKSPVVSSLYAMRTLKGVSLKGKPPDVSTEAFLDNLSDASFQREGAKERDASCHLDDQNDESERIADCSFSASTSSNSSVNNNDSLASPETTANPIRSTKLVYIKRDPRQAAGWKQHIISSEAKLNDNGRKEESQDRIAQENVKTSGIEPIGKEGKQSPQEKDPSYADHLKSGMSHPLSENRGTDHLNLLQKESSKHLQRDSFKKLESLQPYVRGPTGAPSHLEAQNTTESEPSSTSRDICPPVRPPKSILQSPKSCPSLLQIPSPQNFSPVYGFPQHMPPPLIPPPGYGFPRGPSLRFGSVDSSLQNPMVPWPTRVQLPGHYFGPLTQGIPLAPGQSRFPRPQQLFRSDERLPGRRHSDPWDRHDPISDQGFSRGSDVHRRQRFFSESHYQRKNRLHASDLHDEKHCDYGFERNRHRERDRNQEKERDRKSRDETPRDKDRSRLSRSDRSMEEKTQKGCKNSDKHDDKSKHEHTHEKDKEQEKGRDRSREIDKYRERHYKEKDYHDRVKQKR
ncbi:PHD finger protein 3 isoform X2 [Pleurodeles waltl]|uniref:PHD finger protein 3 isoform X2 n=1 Tax=Pleurodeles waltl TaxID=8319 RepID=UPI0037095A86